MWVHESGLHCCRKWSCPLTRWSPQAHSQGECPHVAIRCPRSNSMGTQTPFGPCCSLSSRSVLLPLRQKQHSLAALHLHAPACSRQSLLFIHQGLWRRTAQHLPLTRFLPSLRETSVGTRKTPLTPCPLGSSAPSSPVPSPCTLLQPFTPVVNVAFTTPSLTEAS